MKYLAFILNLPWTVVGCLTAVISIPKKVNFVPKEVSIVIYVRSFWWYTWLPGRKGVRAMTNGHVVLLEPTADIKDRKHELIHVKQYIREPFIHPFLYFWQSYRNGYKNNKYEVEAYRESESRYTE